MIFISLKSQYQNFKKKNFAKQQAIINKHIYNIKHPRKAIHNKFDMASQLGRDNWRQTVAPPNMTRMQAMKEAGHAFNTNVSLSSKITVFIIVIGLVFFMIVGLFF